MNKKIINSILTILLICIITGCNTNKIDNNSKDNIDTKQNNNKAIDNKSEVIDKMRIIINNKEYIINLEDNETTKAFINLLPQEFNMNELNGNEKYVYLDSNLPTNSYNPKEIDKGDVMLYGDNCLVIFYKSFKTSYSYTKIGHIDNLPDLDNSNIKVKFER